MMLAAASAGGIYFFAAVLIVRRWHRVKVGLPSARRARDWKRLAAPGPSLCLGQADLGCGRADVGDHLGLDLLCMISPTRGLAACTPRAARQ
jgi:hypothetical protein